MSTLRTHVRPTRIVPTLLALGVMGSLAQAADPVITSVGASVGTSATVQFAVEWTDDIGGWDPMLGSTTAVGTGGDFRVYEVVSTAPNIASATPITLTAANIVSSNAHKTVFTYTLTGSNKKLYAQIPAASAYALGGANPTTYPTAAIPASGAQLVYTQVPGVPIATHNSILSPNDESQTLSRNPTLAVSVNIDDDESGVAINALFSATDLFKVNVYASAVLVGSTSFTKTGGAAATGTANRQNVSVTLSSALPVGIHTLTTKVQDPVGSLIAAASAAVDVLVWDRPTLLVNGTEASGTTFTLDRTNALEFTGTKFNSSVDGSSVTLTVDGVPATNANLTDPTKFKFTMASLAAGASHTVVLTQTHTGVGLTNHPSLVSTYTIDNSAVDVTPPDAPVISGPQAASTIVTRKPVVTGTTEPNCTVQLRFADVASPSSFTSITNKTSDANGAFSFQVVDWSTALTANATSSIQVRSIDSAGNASPWSSIDYTVVVPANAVKVTFAPVTGSDITTQGGVNYTKLSGIIAFKIDLTDLDGTAITSGAVTGLTAADIVVTNGAVSATTLTTAGGLLFSVTPTAATSVVTISMPALAFTHATGTTANEAATNFTFTTDRAAPTFTPTFVSAGSSTTSVNGAFNVVLTANEPILSADPTKIPLIFVGSGTTLPTVGAATFSADRKIVTFPCTGGVPGAATGLTLTVAAAALTDYAGNTSAAAATAKTTTFDSAALSITSITSTAAQVSKVSPIPFLFTFSKAASGFDASDLDITNGVLGTFTGTGTTYTANIVPGEGPTPVKVAIKSGTVITDVVGTSATITGSVSGVNFLTRTYDSTAPRVLSLTSSTPAPTSTDDKPTNRTSIPCSLVFSESVSGLTAAAFQVEGGSISGLTGAGSAYTFNVDVAAPTTAEKKVRVVLQAGKVADTVLPVGNQNSAVAVLVRNYDGTLPTLDFGTPTLVNAGGATAQSKGAFTIAVNGAAASDVLATKFDATKLIAIGGTIDSISTTNETVNSTTRISTITINVTMPRAAGNVMTIQALPGVLTDLAGNKNASTSANLTIPGAG